MKYDYRMKVTEDTEVPEVPAREDRLKPADKPDFEKKMRGYDDKVDKMRDRIRQINLKKKELSEGAKVGNTDMTYKELLKTKLDELRAVKNEKRSHGDEMRKIQNIMQHLEHKRDQNHSKMHKDYKGLKDIQAAIQEMEKRYETQTIPVAEERQITKDLNILKKSIPFAQEIDKLMPEFEESR